MLCDILEILISPNLLLCSFGMVIKLSISSIHPLCTISISISGSANIINGIPNTLISLFSLLIGILMLISKIQE